MISTQSGLGGSSLEDPAEAEDAVCQQAQKSLILLGTKKGASPRWPQTFNQTDTFGFVVPAKKYGERGAGSGFMLADKAPNEGHGRSYRAAVELA